MARKLLASVAAVSAALLAPTNVTASYLWNYRPVFIFGADNDPSLREQRRIFSSPPGLSERDIVLVWVIADHVQADLGPRPGATASELRERYRASGSNFRIVLVGKDGDIKLSASRPLSAERLFATIDAMPMRRQEMRGAR